MKIDMLLKRCIVFSFVGFTLSQNAFSENQNKYGEWKDILTPAQAHGRFEWLEQCYPGLLLELWDTFYDATADMDDHEKLDQLKNDWFFDANNKPLDKPLYPTFGDSNHKNPKNWVADTDKNSNCKTIPIDYSVVGMMSASYKYSYCKAHAIHSDQEYIKSFGFGGFSNQSGASIYSNYIGRAINVRRNEFYNLVLEPGFVDDNVTFEEYWKVFVDWNGDGDFLDAGERVVSDSGETALHLNIRIPATAKIGLTKLRVQMDGNGGDNNPCHNIDFGEIEDYMLNVYE